MGQDVGMDQDKGIQNTQGNQPTQDTAGEATRRGQNADTPKGLDATRPSEKYVFGEIKSAAGPLITAVPVSIIAGVLIFIGIGQNAEAYRSSSGETAIVFGFVVGAVALLFFLIAVWRLAQQFFEMYAMATQGKPHPEL